MGEWGEASNVNQECQGWFDCFFLGIALSEILIVKLEVRYW